jgi:hypothetical protein
VLTNCNCNDRHDEEPEVGHAPELLEQVLRQEGQQRVLGGDNSILLLAPRLRFGVAVIVCANLYAERVVVDRTRMISLERNAHTVNGHYLIIFFFFHFFG